MFEFKIDVIEELKKKGWTASKIREKKILGQKGYYQIKSGHLPGLAALGSLCFMLDRQPGSIIRYVPDDIPEKTE